MTSLPLQRLCKRIDNGASIEDDQHVTLDSLQALPTWVLLGDPGLGKTFAFKFLAHKEGADYCKASDIDVFEPSTAMPKTLFIDGLDETRGAGSSNLKEKIRRQIKEKNIRSFRLSCRAADWSENDVQYFRKILPEEQVLRVYALLPLDEAQILQLLHQQYVANPAEFVQAAKDRGIDELLYNPQTLIMLVHAVHGVQSAASNASGTISATEQWPSNRRDTYELASQCLLREHSTFHTPQNVPEAMNQAGYLCTLYLLGSSQSVALQSPERITERVASCLYLDEINPDASNHIPWQLLLQQKLFTTESGAVYEPIHRTVAEYLAARYLTERLKDTLSRNRLLGQLIAQDGGIVSNLRGLVGWLAVLCCDTIVRQRLFAADAKAVLNYGDLSLLDVDTKTQLLKHLAQCADMGYIYQDMSRRYAPLAAPEMGPVVIHYLCRHAREPNKDMGYLIAHALAHAPIQAAMVAPLEVVVRDSQQSDHTRRQALTALIKHTVSNVSGLMQLLNDIQSKTVHDPSQALRGVLLETLFPKHIGEDDIFNYQGSQFTGHFSANEAFWLSFEKKVPTLSAETLHQLANAAVVWIETVFDKDGDEEYSSTNTVIETVLNSAILKAGEMATTLELANWLKNYLGRPLKGYDAQANRQSIVEWCENHATQSTEVQTHWLISSPQAFYDALELAKQLPLPQDYSEWLLQIAKIACLQSNHQRALALIEVVVLTYDPIKTLAKYPERLFEWLQDTQQQQTLIEPLLSCQWSTQHFRAKQAVRLTTQEAAKKKQETLLAAELAMLSNDIYPIRKGVHTQALYRMAWAYFETNGSGYISSDYRLKSLFDRLQQDDDLRAAFRDGSINCALKLNCENARDALEANIKQQQLLIQLPALLGAQYLFEDNPQTLLQLSAEQQETLLVMYFLSHAGQTPWVDTLRTTNPDIYASAWLMYAAFCIKKGQTHLSHLYPISHDENYATIARIVLPTILKTLPTKPTAEQLDVCGQILFAAFKHLDAHYFASILLVKWKQKSCTAALRDHLMFWGLLSGDVRFEFARFELALASSFRVEALAANCQYFVRNNGRSFSALKPNAVPLETTAFLIGFFAPACTPRNTEPGVGWVTKQHYASDLVHDAIYFLSQTNKITAHELLKALAALPRCSAWHDYLTEQMSKQAIALRDYLFVPPSASQVAQLLNAGEPSSVADMRAIFLDILDELQVDILGHELQYRNAFWNISTVHYQPHYERRSEELCRDSIAQFITEKLNKHGIDLHIEAAQADKKRSDIRLQFSKTGRNTLRLPIEVKGDWHKDLWTAAEHQLAALYMNDPDCDGLGVYLVLWTGLGCTPPKNKVSTPRNKTSFERAMESHVKESAACNGVSLFVLDIARPVG